MKYNDKCKKAPEGTDDQGTPEEIESRPALKTLIGKKDLVGAEIGVRFGCNSLRMFNFLDIKQLYLIDKRKLPEAISNLEDYKDKVVWLIGKSSEVYKSISDNSLDFVYIDGNHTYEYVKADILLYFPKVKMDGLISGHDYKDFAVGRAVMRAVKEMFGDEINVNPPWWDWWVNKKDYQLMEK